LVFLADAAVEVVPLDAAVAAATVDGTFLTFPTDAGVN
jgi:hypothetical protein